MLAGLISDEERKTTKHVPGLGEIPVVGRAFGTQKDSSNKTEIILLITPRIIRNIHRPEYVQPYLASGTEAAVGAAPMNIRTPEGRTLSMSSRGGSNSAPMTAPQTNADDDAAPPPEADDPQPNASVPAAPPTAPAATPER